MLFLCQKWTVKARIQGVGGDDGDGNVVGEIPNRIRGSTRDNSLDNYLNSGLHKKKKFSWFVAVTVRGH